MTHDDEDAVLLLEESNHPGHLESDFILALVVVKYIRRAQMIELLTDLTLVPTLCNRGQGAFAGSNT